MKLKSELTLDDDLANGGKYEPCDNPKCINAYHYLEEVSYSILQQQRADGLIIDLSFCSLKCLLESDPNKEKLSSYFEEEAE